MYGYSGQMLVARTGGGCELLVVCVVLCQEIRIYVADMVVQVGLVGGDWRSPWSACATLYCCVLPFLGGGPVAGDYANGCTYRFFSQACRVVVVRQQETCVLWE